ncbi:MAG TPA: hypothetical protein VLZ78_02625 [Terrimesophilobacter sp.]|nr:hypothetical protein [Terrimesophilobacter sp.]
MPSFEELTAAGAVPAGGAGEFPINEARSRGPAPGALASVGRGLVQGASFGFADEIGGAIGSLLSGKSYQEVRDEIRTGDKAAEAAHPLLYGAGQLGGGIATSLIPGVNVAKGATAAQTALNLGAQGAIAGAGASEANTPGGVLTDAAAGGVLGAGVGGLLHHVTTRILENAPRRVVDETVADAMSGSRAKDAKVLARSLNHDEVEREAEELFLGKRAAGEADYKPVADAIRKAQASGEPAALADALERSKAYVQKLDETTAPAWGELDKAVAKAGGAGGIRPGSVINDLDDAIQKAGASLGDASETKVLTSVRDQLQRAWSTTTGEQAAAAIGEAAPRLAARLGEEEGALTAQRVREIAEEVAGSDKLPAELRKAIEAVPYAFDPEAVLPGRALRSALTKAQDTAVAALGTIAETEHARLKALPAMVLKRSMDDFLEQAAKASPEAAQAANDIMTRNRRMHLALAFQEGLAQKLDKAQVGKMGIGQRLGRQAEGAAKAGGVIASVATGNPLPAVAGYALPAAGRAVSSAARLTDQQLARLVYAERTGTITKAEAAVLEAIRGAGGAGARTAGEIGAQ